MTRFVNSTLTRSVSAVLIVCILALYTPVSLFAENGPAADDLKQIQNKYYFRGKYAETIDVLTTFLARTDIPVSTEVHAREFLAASYILSGSAGKGKDQFLHLLSQNEAYTGPDPALFKPVVLDAFIETRNTLAAVKLRTTPETPVSADEPLAVAEETSKPVYKKWWFYVGLAAVAVVVAAAAAPAEEENPAPDKPTGTVSVGVRIQ